MPCVRRKAPAAIVAETRFPGGSFRLELRQYLDILKRHKWFIIEAVVVVALAAGVLSSLRTPVYKATARVLLTPNDPTQQLNPTSGLGMVGNDPDRYVAGQISIAESEAVARKAVESLEGMTIEALEGRVSVSKDGQSNVLKISAFDADPTLARNIADAVAKGYIENRRLAAVSGLEGAAKDIEERLAPLQATIAVLDKQIGEGSTLPGAISQLVSPVPPGSAGSATQPLSQVSPPTGPGGLPTTQEALKAARYAAAVQYETLYSRQQELLVDISLKRGDAELIAEAKAPTVPVSPKPKRDAVLGVFVGLLLGAGVSLLREQLNDKVRSAEEVERLTGLPLLAQLPYDEHAADDGLSVDMRPGSPLSEALRALRTSIQYQGVDQPVKIILVTSSIPGEGKSLVAANLAAAFAQADYRTLLVSADLRRPTLNSLFGEAHPSVGLVGVMTSTSPASNGMSANGNGNGHSTPATVEAATVKALVATPISRLLLLPSGPTPPNPAELLGSRRMGAILDQLALTADVVIVDSPPLLPVTDAAVLAAKCDGVIVVVSMNETPRSAIERSKTILDGTGARLLGAVVNKATKSPGGYHYDGAYYGYESLSSAAPRRSRRKNRSADAL